ncbi:unnamed protein product [Camellia sinensis]
MSQETLATKRTTVAATTTTVVKKSTKKKNNNVWTKPASRKGKKKTKNNKQTGQTEDIVLITPIPRFPDKTDDSPDMKICLSKVYQAEKVELDEDRLSVGSTKRYRMVRATRGVMKGVWYFEIKVVKLDETGHTRLGWSMKKGDLQAPVRYDANSYGYRDIDGCKIHKALREKYGEEGYVEGDVIGFYVNLSDGNLYAPKAPHLVWYKGQRELVQRMLGLKTMSFNKFTSEKRVNMNCSFVVDSSSSEVECGQTWPRRQAIKLAYKAYRIRVMFLRRRKVVTEKQLLAVAEIMGIEVEVVGYMMGHVAAEQQWSLKTSNIKTENSKFDGMIKQIYNPCSIRSNLTYLVLT